MSSVGAPMASAPQAPARPSPGAVALKELMDRKFLSSGDILVLDSTSPKTGGILLTDGCIATALKSDPSKFISFYGDNSMDACEEFRAYVWAGCNATRSAWEDIYVRRRGTGAIYQLAALRSAFRNGQPLPKPLFHMRTEENNSPDITEITNSIVVFKAQDRAFKSQAAQKSRPPSHKATPPPSGARTPPPNAPPKPQAVPASGTPAKPAVPGKGAAAAGSSASARAGGQKKATDGRNPASPANHAAGAARDPVKATATAPAATGTAQAKVAPQPEKTAAAAAGATVKGPAAPGPPAGHPAEAAAAVPIAQGSLEDRLQAFLAHQQEAAENGATLALVRAKLAQASAEYEAKQREVEEGRKALVARLTAEIKEADKTMESARTKKRTFEEMLRSVAEEVILV